MKHMWFSCRHSKYLLPAPFGQGALGVEGVKMSCRDSLGTDTESCGSKHELQSPENCNGSKWELLGLKPCHKSAPNWGKQVAFFNSALIYSFMPFKRAGNTYAYHLFEI